MFSYFKIKLYICNKIGNNNKNKIKSYKQNEQNK